MYMSKLHPCRVGVICTDSALFHKSMLQGVLCCNLDTRYFFVLSLYYVPNNIVR